MRVDRKVTHIIFFSVGVTAEMLKVRRHMVCSFHYRHNVSFFHVQLQRKKCELHNKDGAPVIVVNSLRAAKCKSSTIFVD